jgi:hypothetical protein
MGSDTPAAGLFLRWASTRPVDGFENHQAFTPSHLRQFGRPNSAVTATCLPGLHSVIAGWNTPFVTAAACCTSGSFGTLIVSGVFKLALPFPHNFQTFPSFASA